MKNRKNHDFRAVLCFSVCQRWREREHQRAAMRVMGDTSGPEPGSTSTLERFRKCVFHPKPRFRPTDRIQHAHVLLGEPAQAEPSTSAAPLRAPPG